VTAPLPNLDAMFDEMRRAPAIVRPSVFWESLNERNVRQLREDGFESFKQTVNRNYFQFLPADPRNEQFQAVLRSWLKRPTPRPFGARFTDRSRLGAPSDGIRSRALARYKGSLYRLYVALLWDYVHGRDRLGLLDRLEEPELGRPISFNYRGRRISEDLCNSVLEATSVAEALPAPPDRDVVVELGSGYGRLAWVFLEAFPRIRYVLVDIPPALAIAEEYLSRLFPDRTVFRFRHFDAHEQVAAELEQAEIAFLTPNQLDIVAPLEAGLFLNVSSLHEMRPEQIAHYLGRIGTHCRGHFYSKQWLRSVNPDDGVVIHREDYPIPSDWTPVFDRVHPVQTQFFEALYRLPDAAVSGVERPIEPPGPVA
jgi:putative sugar O-methyltransferase